MTTQHTDQILTKAENMSSSSAEIGGNLAQLLKEQGESIQSLEVFTEENKATGQRQAVRYELNGTDYMTSRYLVNLDKRLELDNPEHYRAPGARRPRPDASYREKQAAKYYNRANYAEYLDENDTPGLGLRCSHYWEQYKKVIK